MRDNIAQAVARASAAIVLPLRRSPLVRLRLASLRAEGGRAVKPRTPSAQPISLLSTAKPALPSSRRARRDDASLPCPGRPEGARALLINFRNTPPRRKARNLRRDTPRPAKTCPLRRPAKARASTRIRCCRPINGTRRGSFEIKKKKK